MITIATPPVHRTGTGHCVALARSRHAPAVARRITARWLATRGVSSGSVSDALLVVSELVTNTLRHSSGTCTLTLTAHATTVCITVADTSTQLPRMRAGSAANEDGGRGLALLHDMGARLTVTRTPWGKAVKATLDLRGEAPHGITE
ncbi:ATP-binding protein [Streptomyces triticiradicis]|uniref:ATP-binding protein n=1 Tax=Streptomyces triticiradicis TaxID=2651189 RepID=A0A7J5D6V7_9ACTN|nr:ATP-binding protein [Streptomyces triticiradicis]KAB1980831.1 ATP-binding protein [Streptomyces triticiradicis]